MMVRSVHFFSRRPFLSLLGVILCTQGTHGEQAQMIWGSALSGGTLTQSTYDRINWWKGITSFYYPPVFPESSHTTI